MDPSISSEVSGIKAQVGGGHHVRIPLSGGSGGLSQRLDSGKLPEEESALQPCRTPLKSCTDGAFPVHWRSAYATT